MVGDVCCCHVVGVMVLLLRDSCYCGRRDLNRCLSRGERASRGDVWKREGMWWTAFDGRAHLFQKLQRRKET